VLVATGGLIGWSLGGQTGLLVTALVVLVLGIAVLGFLVVQTERRITSVLLASLRQAITGELKAVGAAAQQLARQSEALANEVEALANEVEALKNRVERPSAQAERLLNAISAGYRRVEQSQQKSVKKSIDSDKETFRQFEALTALYMDTGAKVGFPSTRSWVASPDLLHFLFQVSRKPEFERVMECGSGLSTVILAYGLKAKGSGRVIALEHLPEYASQTEALLNEHGLEDWAEVRLAPLEERDVADAPWLWYCTRAVPNDPIDLLLVDGPPGSTGSLARYPALPILYENLSPGAMVILDDHNRPDEAEIARRWLKEFPDFALTVVKHEKGTAIFHRS
jgi:predicted O-methyltransferase YrrM